MWLRSRTALRPSTRTQYETHIRLYLTPYLGRLRLDQLRVDHLIDMFEQIEEHNALIRLIRTNGSAAQREQIKWRKPANATTRRRIRSVLHGALEAAIGQQLITFDPARYAELDPASTLRPLVWTPERVARWQQTGEVPGSVMVWTPQQTGAFLDHIAGDELYALFHLLVFLGLRRGEVCALEWADIDPEQRIVSIHRQLTLVNGRPTVSEPKTPTGHRQLAVVPSRRSTCTAAASAPPANKPHRAGWCSPTNMGSR